ncbi:MAG: hypothetical protein DMD77_23140 [Candidatus Rokuibacteriota bacterium]|nr:MAG: hypothetical protein DMD77_23140 [Candidatus Rokubacteria bacterium]
MVPDQSRPGACAWLCADHAGGPPDRCPHRLSFPERDLALPDREDGGLSRPLRRAQELRRALREPALPHRGLEQRGLHGGLDLHQARDRHGHGRGSSEGGARQSAPARVPAPALGHPHRGHRADVALDLYRGLFNVGLHDLGIIGAGIHWLGNPDLAMLSVIMANVWRGFPFFGVSFLAAMQTVPQDLYDAASVDGASAWQQFWRVSLPSIKGVVAIVTLLSTIWTLNDFNIVYIMTRGGPGAATHIFATYSYELGIQSQRWGMAMAASMYSLPVIALLIVFVVRYLHREEPAS